MAKKIAKSSKVKAKKKPIKKAAPKKVAKPAKKAAPVAKKAAAKPAPKKAAQAKKATPAKASPVKASPKAAAPAKKAAPASAAKPEKVAKVKPQPAPAKAKPEKKAKAPVVEAPEVPEIDDVEEELVDEEVVLTDAEGRRYCRVKDCDQLASVDAYCRYHYLLFWKKIQIRKKILSEGKLERYIEELTARYPDKFLDMLRKDLRSEKEFLAAIQELEIDESAVDNEFEDEAQTYIDEVRGMGEPTGAREEEDF